ncbi:MAG: hypothetical protein RL685_6868 [Pseudomonadota bacterium]|jgi:hypothetical protein
MSRATTGAGRGRGLCVWALVVATGFACEAKVYPLAQPEMKLALEPDTQPGGAVELTAGAGGMPGSDDSGSTEQDGAHVVPATVGANSGGGDASEPAPVADAGCSPVLLFRDRDGDGFGSSALEDVIQECSPVDGYVTDNTDCHDAEHSARDPAGDVFPGQTAFFTVGYPTANGISFDYDCSEHEEADPDNAFVPAVTSCEEREQPCGFDLGYVTPADARSGVGVNPLCGVREQAWCTSSSRNGCALLFVGAMDPFPCR